MLLLLIDDALGQAIVRLCADEDEDVRQSACDAVAIIALHETNKKRLIATPGCVDHLVACCSDTQPDGACLPTRTKGR